MKPLPRPVARPAARPAAPLRRGIPAIVLGLGLAGFMLSRVLHGRNIVLQPDGKFVATGFYYPTIYNSDWFVMRS